MIKITQTLDENSSITDVINPTDFPDGTKLIRFYPGDSNSITITWLYDNDGELFQLIALTQHLKAKGIEVIGIVIDILDNKGQVSERVKTSGEKIIKNTGADYTHVIPNIEMFSGLLRGVQAVPTTIFVDSNGNQVGNAYLGSRSQKDWQKIIDGILEK